MKINEVLMKLPLASSVFLVYAITGAIMLVSGTIEYGAFSNNLLVIGIACGAIGAPRAVSKVAAGTPSINLLGVIESLEIPSIVFVVFLIVSSVSLATGAISFGEFSENVGKVGIACGVIQATRAVERVYSKPALKTPAVSG